MGVSYPIETVFDMFYQDCLFLTLVTLTVTSSHLTHV